LPADFEAPGTARYIDLDRKDAKAQWEKIKKDNPYGFDIVVEATGVESIVDDAINYVRRGGTLLGTSLPVGSGLFPAEQMPDAQSMVCTTMWPGSIGARPRSS
jgi:threonine dehydrogenase-like Zn-dependent dehydrogenase